MEEATSKPKLNAEFAEKIVQRTLREAGAGGLKWGFITEGSSSGLAGCGKTRAGVGEEDLYTASP
jgi:hypothetical protein